MLTAPPKRHTLLKLTNTGTGLVWANREALYPGEVAWADMWPRFYGLPVITRRQVLPGEAIPVGLSLPIRQDGGRYRLASCVPASEVESAVSPTQAAELCAGQTLPVSGLVAELLCDAPSLGVSVGIFGSAALEAVTGLPYRHAGSDLDVLLIPRDVPDLPTLAGLLHRLEENYQLPIDAELALGEKQYVKLKELCTDSRTVLVKGGQTPVLCSSRSVLESLRCCGNIKEK